MAEAELLFELKGEPGDAADEGFPGPGELSDLIRHAAPGRARTILHPVPDAITDGEERKESFRGTGGAEAELEGSSPAPALAAFSKSLDAPDLPVIIRCHVREESAVRSDAVKVGIERAPHRALLHATGVTKEELSRPFIGIANSASDLVPGHVHLNALARAVERGIEAGGGRPFQFGIPAICDGIAMGHAGMRYPLPSRELIADSVESVVEAHALDGVVLLCSCDKIIPGMAMALARLDVPGIVVTGGPMLGWYYANVRRSLVRDTFEAVGLRQAGKITDEELSALEEVACPSCGSCQGMYTANTMACVVETLGLSLSYCATAPAPLSEKTRLAYLSGVRAVELVKEDMRPGSILTLDAFRNAVAVDMALGGSTNTALHLLAIANEAGVKVGLELFDEFCGKVPLLTSMRPAGDHMMEDLHRAGGMPALFKQMGALLLDCPTVNGNSIKEIARAAKVWDEDVIHPLSSPCATEASPS